jgi:TusA-related sulfurtransferase
MSGTQIYGVWRAMMQRCHDKNSHAFDRYGARGIIVCGRWKKFENFYADMGEKPTAMSMERIDNNGSYCPENVVWATTKQQANNRRSSVILEHNGKKQTMQQWCDELGLKMLLQQMPQVVADLDILFAVQVLGLRILLFEILISL